MLWGNPPQQERRQVFHSIHHDNSRRRHRPTSLTLARLPTCVAGMRLASRHAQLASRPVSRQNLSSPLSSTARWSHLQARHDHDAATGGTTPPLPLACPKLPFRFDTGFSLYAKRPPRPFPPPFLSPPSTSFTDPLSTHNRSRDRRHAFVDGELVRGWTNGDDAVYASDNFICANDGVGAWSARPRGHAG